MAMLPGLRAFSHCLWNASRIVWPCDTSAPGGRMADQRAPGCSEPRRGAGGPLHADWEPMCQRKQPQSSRDARSRLVLWALRSPGLCLKPQKPAGARPPSRAGSEAASWREPPAGLMLPGLLSSPSGVWHLSHSTG